jgi:hypothetical protein
MWDKISQLTTPWVGTGGKYPAPNLEASDGSTIMTR